MPEVNIVYMIRVDKYPQNPVLSVAKTQIKFLFIFTVKPSLSKWQCSLSDRARTICKVALDLYNFFYLRMKIIKVHPPY